MLVTCVVTPVFNVLTIQPTFRSAIQGVVDGEVIPVLMGGYLMFVRDGVLREWFRRFSFGANVAFSGTIVLALFLVGRAAGQVVTTGDARRFIMSFADAHLVYALPFFIVVAFAIQFLLQMNRMVGANVLRYFVAGVYHRPRTEERIFLFLDLVASGAVLDHLTLPPGVEARRCGDLLLRGKEKQVDAYSLEGAPSP